MMPNPWLLVVLLALGIVLTLGTNWLVSGRRRPSVPRRYSASDILAAVASLLWIMLIVAAGIVTSRYIERIDHAAIVYLCFGLAAAALSWIRAVLFHRIQTLWADRSVSASSDKLDSIVQTTNYLLFSIAVYLLAAWILKRTVEPFFFVPLWFGALAPDLDSPDSAIGRLLPSISRRLASRLGQRQGWHSLAANLLVAVLTLPLLLVGGTLAWALLSLGFLSHLLLDLFTPKGVMLFWPLNESHYSLGGKDTSGRDPSRSRSVLAAMTILSALLLLSVDFGSPAPAAVPSPSYEQTLKQYYSLRGNNLVYAYVQGTWQASGRRTSGTFEILNAVGDSYIMLDRYAGEVFSAGRSAEDNLYLNRITLQTGSAASIRPVELHLEEQPIGDGLQVLYEMQQEPGLQHIYVSGDIVVTPTENPGSPILQQDFSQTSIRRIQALESGHFSLHYLTAGDLIALAHLPVEIADLLVVATYAADAAGVPTVTPLPTSGATPQPAQ